jgi:glycosyltransferase involved in cell wall biosynthesis
VSISDAQRVHLPFANWVSTVYHGMQADLASWFHPRPGVGGYLAFLGRMSPEKGPDKAIEIAKRLGIPLKMAAKVDPHDSVYFREVIKPMLAHPLIEYVGEIGDAEKPRFLGGARALLFPIDWPEPFGLVMIEAMACGTPVIAFNRGSVPEVIEDGVTGFVVEDEAGAIGAVDRLSHLSRKAIRDRFEQRYTARRMALDYLSVYRELMDVATPRLRVVAEADAAKAPLALR